MSAAQAHIQPRAADNDLIPALGRSAVPVEPGDHGGALAARADCPDFAELVSPSQKSRAAREELAPEVHPEPVAHDRNLQIVGHTGKCPDLISLKELGFVNENASNVFELSPGRHLREEVFPGGERRGWF